MMGLGKVLLAGLMVLSACGRSEPQQQVSSHHAVSANDPVLKRAQGHERSSRPVAHAALLMRADEIQATSILRRRLGRGGKITQGENQVLAAAGRRRQTRLDDSPEAQLRRKLGTRHIGRIEATR